jgi:hypothetical protein
MTDRPKRPGRPKTTTDEQKRAQSALRSSRYRQKKARNEKLTRYISSVLARRIASHERITWTQFLAFVNGFGEDLQVRVDYETPEGKQGGGEMSMSALAELILAGNTIEKLV